MVSVKRPRKEAKNDGREKPIPKIVPVRPPAGERHLLAVDMGLRTGLAIFGPDGRLISYRSKHFGSLSELRRGVGTILKECPPLGWLWLEGGGDIATVWEKRCAHLGIDFRQVQAADWRKTLMLPRQQVNGEKAKKEAIEMAKRVIEWSGAPRPKGPLRHDAAEAILVGVHGALSVALLDEVPPM
jgi:hypothetical protein